MAWYSLLPPHLTIYETWAVRTFLFLAILNVAPWILAILYDLVLWITRCIWHEIPVYGGRAQGARRPRAPSLRDSGRRRSFAEMITGTTQSRTHSHENAIAELRARDHQRKRSNNALEEEENESRA